MPVKKAHGEGLSSWILEVAVLDLTRQVCGGDSLQTLLVGMGCDGGVGLLPGNDCREPWALPRAEIGRTFGADESCADKLDIHP